VPTKQRKNEGQKLIGNSIIEKRGEETGVYEKGGKRKREKRTHSHEDTKGTAVEPRK